mgnify:CR=1 FL=1
MLKLNFQEIIFALNKFWSEQKCVIEQPYDIEVGAGTMSPSTFLRALGPEEWNTAYVQPSRRPTDGRYGDNPYRLGAWGLGWEVWLDGMEITQFTYFQQVGGFQAKPVTVEITYGLERIAMYLQEVENVFDLTWVEGVNYGDIYHQNEVEQSKYNFETADVDSLFKMFDLYESEAENAVNSGLTLPAYDYTLKCSHTFNLLDARGAISVTERTRFIKRVRDLAHKCAESYLE